MSNLKDSISDINEEMSLKLVTQRIESEDEPSNILNDLRNGMEILGQRFADNEYSLVELMMGAEIFKECMEIIEPKLKKNPAQIIGKVVIGTVKGDIHNLGKNIVSAMLRGAGFEVYDIGVDKSPEEFLEKIREVEPNIVGLSCLLSTTLGILRETVSMIKQSGINTKIMIGGGIFSGITGDQIIVDGVDGLGKNAIEAVNLANTWINNKTPREESIKTKRSK